MHTQAGSIGAAYGAVLVPSRDSMLPFLAAAAVELRTAAERKQVHVAASADLDQSTIWRFERGESWPRDPDQIIRAYADDLGVTAEEIWARGLGLWEAASAPTRPEGADTRTESGTPAPGGELGRRLAKTGSTEQNRQRPGSQEERGGPRRTAA
jgi:hypothetical protein